MPELFPSSDLSAVWLVRSRQMLSQLDFWLILVGYSRKSRSLSNWIYLVYVFIFFSIWIFAVLLLLADYGGQALRALPFGSPFLAAAAVGGAALLAVFLIELGSASRRSPFIFSEVDSTLLCLTPVDRRAVALIWFLHNWLVRSPFLWAGAIVLGYAYIEAQALGELGTADLPRYLIAGLRMLSVFLPLLLAAQSLAWSVGAWRLGWRRDRPILRWMAPALALLVLGAWVIGSTGSGTTFPAWAWGMAFPVRAGLGAASLAGGIGIGVLLAIAGLYLLWAAAAKMSLARAAQETHGQETLQRAVLFGANDLAQKIRQRQRLGAGKKPSRLPVRPGLAALAWKNSVQGLRSFTIGQLLPWLWILGLSLAVMQASAAGTIIWMLLVWIFFLGGPSVQSLRRDLSRWWLLHQLPYASEQLVLMDLGIPLAAVALIGVAALVLAPRLGMAVPAAMGWLFLPGAAGVILAAAADVLRQCKSGHLIAGNAPDRSLLSVLIGGLVFGIPGGIAWLALEVLSFPAWLGITAMLAACVGIDYGLYRWTGFLLRKIR